MIKALFKWNPKLSDRQYTIMSWWMHDSLKDKDGIIADGAIRSGKTVSMGFSFVMWAMHTFNHQDFAMCGKTVGSLKRNVMNTLRRQVEQRGYTYTYKRTENLVIISKGSITNNFYLFGGKDEASQDLIQGMTATGVFFDEVALMPESFVTQATARCSVEGSKYWFNCNPSNPQHWFKVNWIDKAKEKNLLYLHFTMDDNPSLSEKIKQRYRSMYTGVFYARYIKGLWVAAEGLIYDMFSKEKNVVQDVNEQFERDFYVSADYGIQNATVFLEWHKVRGKNQWICTNEYYYSGRDNDKQKTVAQLVDGVENMLNGRKPKKFIIDPSATALKVELKKRGYKVSAADNSVNNGIADVQTALELGLIKIGANCTHTIEEFGLYAWDKKASERGEDKPIKTNDHCMDAVRYFVKTKNIVNRKELTEQELADLIYLS